MVNTYNIDLDLVDTFLNSMEMDLSPATYDESKYEKYILGSAQVVGLMCLKVFLNGNEIQYNELKPHAMSLGSAFQKINFLRDIKADYSNLGRTYFPNVDMNTFSLDDKVHIEVIFKKILTCLNSVKKLPKSSAGVYLTYILLCYLKKFNRFHIQRF